MGNERQRWHDKRGHGQQCNNLLVNMAALGGREAGPGQSNGEHGHIERKCGGDMTRGWQRRRRWTVGWVAG